MSASEGKADMTSRLAPEAGRTRTVERNQTRKCAVCNANARVRELRSGLAAKRTNGVNDASVLVTALPGEVASPLSMEKPIRARTPPPEPSLRGQKGSGKEVWNQHSQPIEQSSRNSAQCDLF